MSCYFSVITKVMLKTSPNAQKCPGKNGINKAIIINDFTNSYNYMSYWQRRLVSLTFICFIKMRMMSRSYSIQMQVPKMAATRVRRVATCAEQKSDLILRSEDHTNLL